MITSDTRKILNLPSYLKPSCEALFFQLCNEFESIDAIAEAIQWWHKNPEQLNKVWWTLNYNTVRLDPHRKLRAIIERLLDNLAEEKSREAVPCESEE